MCKKWFKRRIHQLDLITITVEVPGGCLENIWTVYIETSLIFNQPTLFLQCLIKLKTCCTSNNIVSIVTKLSQLM